MAETPLRWETISSKIAYDCPGFAIRQDHVELPNGTTTTFDYLEDAPSVVIIPVTPENDIVVINEWRHAVNRVSYGFPAGGAEPTDPDIIHTAHRELSEETGYTTDDLAHLITVEPANGISNATHHYFIGYNCHQTTEPDHDQNESIQVTTTTLAELTTQIKTGQIRDGRTILGVLYYTLIADT